MKVVISSGHGLHVKGAVNLIDEVTEARKVVDKVVRHLEARCAQVLWFHDNESKNQAQNLNTIVSFHNSQVRDLDVSVHFNASGGAGHGVEVLYLTEEALASKVAKDISDASGLKNRGAKKRTDLAFLNNTKKPAILIEVCFTDNANDVMLYQEYFDEICKAIADVFLVNKDNKNNLIQIAGTPIVSAEQMSKYISRINKDVSNLAHIYIEEGKKEYIRGDIAFAQSCLETGNFTFSGGTAVTLDQNNFCGMGVVSIGIRGNFYKTPQDGILAQIQHLKAYANNSPLNTSLVQPTVGESRFRFVQRGVAPYVQWLGAKENPQSKGWASDAGYGSKILAILDKMSAV